MSKIKHRPEIDGLRAIAVIPVVLFHVGLGFTGGYVGVDVFFVISGYLITSLILKDLDAGTFRILDFWERRVRRILPALALVVLACIVAGWLMFIPTDFKKLGQSVVAQSVFLSNVFFWKRTEYFTSNETQPLLHTWSLAVEEQFYILFPLSLIMLRRFARRTVVWVLAGIALISLGLSIYGSYFRPTAAFYLPPYRAWELLLGSLLAAMPESRRRIGWLDEGLSWLGLLGILGAALFYDRQTRFPGVAALLPCLGAGLILATNAGTRTLAGRILSWRPVVFVGLISYSLYLWHWPVLIFSKYWALAPLSLIDEMVVVAASFLLAAFSWRIVETPFRRRVVFNTRPRIFAFGGLTIAALLIAGLAIHHRDGFRPRWRPEALRYMDGQDDKDFRIELGLAAVKRGDLTAIGYKGSDRPIDLLVWGDSHGMAVLHVLDVICGEAKVRGVAATHSATVPLLNFPCMSTYSLKEATLPYNQAVVDFVRERRVRNVLLVAAWSGYVSSQSTPKAKDQFSRALTETLTALNRAGAKVFIMKDVPMQSFDVPKALAIAANRGRDLSKLGIPANEFRSRTAYQNELFDKAASASVIVLDPVPLLTGDIGITRIEKDGRPLYFDKQHLTIYGEMQLRPLFDGLIAASRAGWGG